MSRKTHRRRGMTLIELLAAATILILLTTAVIIATREGRRQASLGDNFANLKQFAFGTGAYAADNDDRVWGFSWRAMVTYDTRDDPFGRLWPAAANETQAAANQAIDLISRRGHRLDIPQIVGWAPHMLYSHLVLLDYLEARFPARFVAAPEDRLRLLWQRDPQQGFYNLPPTERPGSGSDNVHKRWPYSSSYELGPAFMSKDALQDNIVTLAQGPGHNSYYIEDRSWRLRRLSEVAFPSHKVMVYEQYQRHFGPAHIHFGYNVARVPVLLVDGSTRVLHTPQANFGFQPNSPLAAQPTRFSYNPDLWEPPYLHPSLLLIGYYRWTRSGLRGRDVGGPEVPWVP